MNTLERALANSPQTRCVILHADDVGMCEASVSSYREILKAEQPVSASTMVPCPWFPAAAKLCREFPHADMGVHLTLTSEWDHYRWGPISTRAPEARLCDEEGYFQRTTERAMREADLNAAHAEFVAQTERAIASGIRITHFDCHMGIMYNPRFLPLFGQLGRRYRLPLLNTRWTAAMIHELQVSAAPIEPLPDFPRFDYLCMSPLDRPDEDAFERTRRMIGELPVGLSMFLFHPSRDTPELRAIAPDHRARIADFEVLSSGKVLDWLKEEGVTAVLYRDLARFMA